MSTSTFSRPAIKGNQSRKPSISLLRLSPSEIAALVPMEALLPELGFHVNSRTRRAACRLHGGTNPSAFAWEEDGRWICFNCGKGGDKIALVKAVRGCGFKEALAFLGRLAGVEVFQHRPNSRELAERRRKQARVEYAAEKLRLLEAHLRRRYREEIHKIEQLKQKASRILKEKSEHRESQALAEWAWSAVGVVIKWLPQLTAAYSILCFASAGERAKFALHPEQAEEIINQTIYRGYVTDDRGRVCEVL